ncbi:hypothetical protein [Pseudomonas sp. MHK4]|jgi:hypothetical protein
MTNNSSSSAEQKNAKTTPVEVRVAGVGNKFVTKGNNLTATTTGQAFNAAGIGLPDALDWTVTAAPSRQIAITGNQNVTITATNVQSNFNVTVTAKLRSNHNINKTVTFTVTALNPTT